MHSKIYEIVEMADGDIALCPSDDKNSEPLVRIRFSREIVETLAEAKYEIARAMIESGIDAAMDINVDMEHALSEAESEADIVH